MCCTVVDGQAGRKSHPREQAIPFSKTVMAGQRSHRVLNVVGNFRKAHAWFYHSFSILADLAVDLCALSEVFDCVAIHPVEMTLLLVSRPVEVVIRVVMAFATRVLASGEKDGQWHSRGIGLCGREVGFPFSLLLLFLLLLFVCRFLGVVVCSQAGAPCQRRHSKLMYLRSTRTWSLIRSSNVMMMVVMMVTGDN